MGLSSIMAFHTVTWHLTKHTPQEERQMQEEDAKKEQEKDFMDEEF